jgi:hypothetical protein
MLGDVRDIVMTAGNDLPATDFAVRKTIAAHRFLAELTPPYGRVLHDYSRNARATLGHFDLPTAASFRHRSFIERRHIRRPVEGEVS